MLSREQGYGAHASCSVLRFTVALSCDYFAAYLPLVSGAVQQLAAGLAFLPPAIADGRVPQQASPSAWIAFFYLVFFGSIVGYSSYIYALETLPVALVSIYTYVNPLVAAVLGWIFYREPSATKKCWRWRLSSQASPRLGASLTRRNMALSLAVQPERSGAPDRSIAARKAYDRSCLPLRMPPVR